ncbi:hypothetical protein PT974_10884 [Cladobotryum mycophilum]|uniref:Uncharacterized protein n=1 Tax=Cladobotryum mycophilum TaxID=491253 RepID=A0ABR0SB33_9HYPO
MAATEDQATKKWTFEGEIADIEHDVRRVIARLRFLRSTAITRDFYQAKYEQIDRGPKVIPTSPLSRYSWSQDEIEMEAEPAPDAAAAADKSSPGRQSSLDLQAILDLPLFREDDAVQVQTARTPHLDAFRKSFGCYHPFELVFPDPIRSTDELGMPPLYTLSPSSISSFSLGGRTRSRSRSRSGSPAVRPGTIRELLDGSETDGEDDRDMGKKQRPIGSEMQERRLRLSVRPCVETIEESEDEDGGGVLL